MILYTHKINEAYISKFLEMDKICEYFALGEIIDNQIQMF